jgi:hypothetical protein
MSLQTKINKDLIEAQREKEEKKISVLRFLNSAIKNLLIDKKMEKDAQLEDSEVEKIIKSQIKQLKDAMADFEKAGRDDLAKANKEEMAILENYLPEQMSESQVKEIIDNKMKEFGEVTKSDFGKLMGAVMKDCGGQADGEMVKRLVEQALS